MIKKILLVVLLIVSINGISLFAAQGDDITLKIAVIGPGDELYFWWGHIALVVENNVTGQSYFFDYGLFSFDNDNFFYNFAFGRLLYSCGVSYSESNYNVYKSTNRDITVYTFDLPPEAKTKVYDFAALNVLPENRDYFYHHFRDNCSTRIRDIIDLAVNGQFYNEYSRKTSRFTLREHVRRHTWFSPIVDWFLNFLMGQNIDVPITVWDDMFLPSEVGKHIEQFYYTDENGQRIKLVSSVEQMSVSHGRPAVLEKPRKQWPYQLTLSLALSVVFCFFFFLQSRNIKAGKVLSGLSMSLCGFVFGISGLLLYFMALFTNHDYTYQNANMIYCTPLILAAVPLGISYFTAKDHFKYLKYSLLLRIIWLLCVLGIFISMLIKLLPVFYQDNLTDQLLMLPIALTFALNPFGLKEILDRFFPRKNPEQKPIN